ncbi:MAG: outer membrane protein assembly factor BamD [Planctomycetia bacterium]|nr:outer membrane protein assembly factor BamD [Planctomycetia bacterium]
MRQLAALVFLALALPAAAGWRWDPDEGFVQDRSVAEPASPESADELAAAGMFGQAGARYAVLAEAAGPDIAVRKLAWLRCGDARILARDWQGAIDAYDAFAALAETHPERLRAVRFQVESCIMGVRLGAGFDFFGIIRGAQWAAKRGRELLTKFPYEDWSANARLRFAIALLDSGQFEEAVVEYEFLLNDFPDSPFTPTARYRKAEAHLSQFGGVGYDPQPLEDARREFRRYLDDYPSGDKVDLAKARLGDVDELQAELDWQSYEHYRHLRRWRAARTYLREIVRKFPRTTWAERAREELPGVEEKVKRLPAQAREKGAR